MQRQARIEFQDARLPQEDLSRTKQWGVVVNPMLQPRRVRGISRRERRLSRALSIGSALIVVVGAIAQVAVAAVASGQAKRQSELLDSIRALQNQKRAAQVVIDNRAGLEGIEQRALKLGLIFPQEGQLRSVRVLLSDANESRVAKAAE